MENFTILALGALFMLGLIIFLTHDCKEEVIIKEEEEEQEVASEETKTEE